MNTAIDRTAPIELCGGDFHELFPFHFATDKDLTVVQTGRVLARLCSDMNTGSELAKRLKLIRPGGKFVFEQFIANQKELFLFEHLATKLLLRGQVLLSSDGQSLIFLVTPWLTETEQIEKHGITLEDYPIHDSAADLINLLQSQRLALQDAKKLTDRLAQQRAELQETNHKLQLQEAEQRKLGLIAARTVNGVVLTDADGYTIWVNQGFERLSGYTMAEMIGKKPGSILQGTATDKNEIQRIRKCLHAGQNFTSEILNYAKGGRLYWVRIEVQPIYDDTGKITNYMAIETDITERRSYNQRLQILYEISQVLATTRSKTEGLRAVLQSICHNISFSVGQIWKVKDKALEFFDGWHPSGGAIPSFCRSSRDMRFKKGEDFLGSVWMQRQPAWIDDLNKCKNFHRLESALADSLHFGMAFPIWVQGKIWGVMEFYGTNGGNPDPTLMRSFVTIGNQVGLFIERRLADEQLTSEKELLGMTLDGIGEGVITIDLYGLVQLMNPAAERLTKWPTKQAQNKPIKHILNLQNRLEGPVDIVEQALKSGAEIGDLYEGNKGLTFQARDGAIMKVAVNVRPIFAHGSILAGALIVFRDISSEQEMEQLKKNIVYAVSHELRTPVAAIRGTIATLQDWENTPDETRSEFLNIAAEQAVRLSNLVEDILEVSQMESNQFTYNNELLSVVDIAEQSLREIQTLAARKKIQITFESSGQIEPLWSDRARMFSIFINLLSNAVKFTPEQGRVRLLVQREKGGVIIIVEDNGVGIPKEDLSKIYEPFFRVNHPDKETPGTGLGLSIVRSTVERLGGRIIVESELGKGARFQVTLPLHPARPDSTLNNLA